MELKSCKSFSSSASRWPSLSAKPRAVIVSLWVAAALASSSSWQTSTSPEQAASTRGGSPERSAAKGSARASSSLRIGPQNPVGLPKAEVRSQGPVAEASQGRSMAALQANLRPQLRTTSQG